MHQSSHNPDRMCAGLKYFCLVLLSALSYAPNDILKHLFTRQIHAFYLLRKHKQKKVSKQTRRNKTIKEKNIYKTENLKYNNPEVSVSDNVNNKHVTQASISEKQRIGSPVSVVSNILTVILPSINSPSEHTHLPSFYRV